MVHLTFVIRWLALGLVVSTQALAQSDPGWRLVWSDEFDRPNGSSPDPAKWTFDLGGGGWGNNEWQYYTSRTNNARIENGLLILEARKENYQGSNYTSARLKTQGKASWLYGRIEARIQIPRTQGIWPAFWMLGTNITSVGWPNCGEIDIMENIGREPTIVHGTVHGPGYSGGSGIGEAYSLPDNAPFADDFHVYAVEWTTNQIRWFVDGVQYFSVTPASLPAGTTWVFNQPQFVILNVAVGGNWPGYPDATTVFPQQMRVDYVRVYAPTNLPACATNALVNPGFESGGLAQWTTYGAGFNTLLAEIRSLPVRLGNYSFKVFGRFTGSDNYSGAFQDVPVSAGQIFRADGWALTPANDRIAGANSAWLEVTFRNATNGVLRMFRSAPVTASSPPSAWLSLAVTNELNPTTYVVTGTVSRLVAPAEATTARLQMVFRQPAMAAGAVLFDDLRLLTPGDAAMPEPVTATWAGGQVNLAFVGFLPLPYEVRWKENLTDPVWQMLTNLVGTGATMTLAVQPQAASRFYRVLRRCE